MGLESGSSGSLAIIQKVEESIMNIGIMIIAIIGGATGLLSTLYLAVSFPAVIVWKLYRKAVHKIPLTK